MQRKSKRSVSRTKKRGPNISLKGQATNAEWLFGTHATFAALANPKRACHRLLIHKNNQTIYKAWLETQDPKIRQKIPEPEIASHEYFNQFLLSRPVHQGFAALVHPLPEQSLEDIINKIAVAEEAKIVILDQVTDPQNVGSIMRSAHAFGAIAVIIQSRNAPQASGTIAKAASGAFERIPLLRVTNLARAISSIKKIDCWVTGLDPNANQVITEANFSIKSALVLGSEDRGLRQLTAASCDQLIRIELQNNFNSLNISNAAAIGLYETSRRISNRDYK